MIQLTCMTLPYAHVSLERALDGIARAGYRYVALGLPHEGKEVLDEHTDQERLTALQQALDRWQLKPNMLIGTKALAPGQPEASGRAYLEIAKQLGVPEVLSLGTWSYQTFPDVPLPEDVLQQKHEAFVNAFRKWADIADELDLTLTIKPHTGNTATARHLNKTLADIGSNRVKASYDPGNVQFYEGIDSAEDFPLIAKETVSLIAKDHRGARAHHDFPLPGEGDVAYQQIFQQLKDVAFTGPIVVERVDGTRKNPMVTTEVDQQIQNARQKLEYMLKEVGLAFE